VQKARVKDMNWVKVKARRNDIVIFEDIYLAGNIQEAIDEFLEKFSCSPTEIETEILWDGH
jgi:hypothetical protein